MGCCSAVLGHKAAAPSKLIGSKVGAHSAHKQQKNTQRRKQVPTETQHQKAGAHRNSAPKGRCPWKTQHQTAGAP